MNQVFAPMAQAVTARICSVAATIREAASGTGWRSGRLRCTAPDPPAQRPASGTGSFPPPDRPIFCKPRYKRRRRMVNSKIDQNGDRRPRRAVRLKHSGIVKEHPYEQKNRHFRDRDDPGHRVLRPLLPVVSCVLHNYLPPCFFRFRILAFRPGRFWIFSPRCWTSPAPHR